MKKLLLAAGLASLIGFTACNDVNIYKLEKHQGAYILNQGANNGSISYYNYEREECTNDVYTAIGSGATSMAITKSSDFTKGVVYVTVPSANSIERIDLDGMTDAGNIEVAKPMDVLLSGEKNIYIAHDEASVSSYDLANNKILKTYDVAAGPQKLISSGKYLYAACKGDNNGAKVFVIDMSNEQKVDTVDLAFNNPIDMVVDVDRNVWVYCNGDTQGLIKLEREFVTDTLDIDMPTERDTTYLTNEPVQFELGAKLADSPNPLTISRDGRTLYYVYGKLCKNSVYINETEELSKSAIVFEDYVNEPFSGVDYDARRGRMMALTSRGELVVLRYSDDWWKVDEVYDVGANPIMTGFNF